MCNNAQVDEAMETKYLAKGHKHVGTSAQESCTSTRPHPHSQNWCKEIESFSVGPIQISTTCLRHVLVSLKWKVERSVPHFVTIPPSIFTIFLLSFSIFPFSLVSMPFFPVGQQKFPGQKSLGGYSAPSPNPPPPRLLRHCYRYLYTINRTNKWE